MSLPPNMNAVPPPETENLAPFHGAAGVNCEHDRMWFNGRRLPCATPHCPAHVTGRRLIESIYADRAYRHVAFRPEAVGWRSNGRYEVRYQWVLCKSESDTEEP